MSRLAGTPSRTATAYQFTLKEGTHFRVVDLRHNRYVLGGPYSIFDLTQIPVTLSGAEPLILLIEPEQKAARVEYVTGADTVSMTVLGRKLDLMLQAVPGSSVELHLEAEDQAYGCETPGFAPEPTAGGFVVFAGPAPAGGVVRFLK